MCSYLFKTNVFVVAMILLFNNLAAPFLWMHVAFCQVVKVVDL